MICKKCNREAPNNKWFTKKGCIWCSNPRTPEQDQELTDICKRIKKDLKK